MVAVGCNNNSDTPTYDTIVLDFESLSNAIDSSQYGGSLLYGSGYSWYDETTNLGSTLPNFWGDNTFFGGGIAISNYFYTPEKINYELSQYSEELSHRPQIIVANNIDSVLEEEEIYQNFKNYVEKNNLSVVYVSAVTGEGLADIIAYLEDDEDRAKRAEAEKREAEKE